MGAVEDMVLILIWHKPLVLYHVMERICHIYITGMICLPHIHFAQILIFIEHRYLLYFIESVLSYYLCMSHETWALMIRCMRVSFLLNLLLFCVIRSLLFWLVLVFDFVSGLSLSLNFTGRESVMSIIQGRVVVLIFI